MASINIGSLKFNWKGTYNGSTAYAVDDVTEYNGSSYICILASTGNLPTNTTYFQPMATKGTDGTDVGTTLTTQGDILYRDGSGLQRLAKGTAGQVLKMNAGATAPEYGTLSSDYVYLGGASTSNTSDLHVDLFSADYDIYEVFIHNWYGTAAGNGTQLQFNTAANTPQTGSNYRHIFSGYYWNNSDGNGDQRTGDWNDSNIALSNLGGGSDANVYRLTFINPFSASYRTSVVMTGGGHETNHIYSRHGQGYYNVAQQHTGFTLFASSGNIYIDYLKVYGLKTS